jgi:hypothetical protein
MHGKGSNAGLDKQRYQSTEQVRLHTSATGVSIVQNRLQGIVGKEAALL